MATAAMFSIGRRTLYFFGGIYW